MKAHRILLGAVLAIALTGCGGGTKGGQDAVPSFSDQATAICARAHQDLLSIPAGVADPSAPTEADRAAAAIKIADYLTTELDGLKRVAPPAAQAAAYTKLLTSIQHVITAARTSGAAFINPAKPPFAAMNANATGLGLDGCVQ